MEVFSEFLNFESVIPEVLAQKLRRFYCEAKPKNTAKRAEDLTLAQSENYHKNSLKSIRSAINRHLQDLGRSIDIVRDKEFKSANNTLDGMLKTMTKTGASRATNHKAIIHAEDLERISSYFRTAPHSPIVLRQCVWYNLSLHFVTRGLEFHHQLRMDSFQFPKDENNLEYATLRHETQAKNFQGGIGSDEAPAGKRLYEVPGSDVCPIKMLRLLMCKTDSTATSLFNTCFKEALTNAESDLWYSSKPLVKKTFSGFMSDVCKSAKCAKTYTPHCLRATAITAMSDGGFEARQIMYMSGHRCEGSLKTYNRELSNDQKKSMSSCLSLLTHPKSRKTSLPSPASTTYTASSASLSVSPREHRESHVFDVSNFTHPAIDSSSSARAMMSSDFLSKSVFNHCVFNFSK